MNTSAPVPQSRAQQFFRWLLLGIPGAFVFFATVPVEDARSNLAGWLHVVGVDQVPAILATAGADLVVNIVSIAIPVLAAIFNWFGTRTWLRERAEHFFGTPAGPKQ